VRHGVVGVRFNFRGVGRSQGSYDDGEGELADARAIADWAAGRCGAAQPLLFAGFSFGGAVAYRAAAASRPLAVITVAPAVDRIPPSTAEPECDWLLVQGSADEIIAPATVRAWLAARTRAPTQVWLPGVGHFFHGELGALSRAVTDFLNQDETGADRAQSAH
jgi:alpha/beta superfamily hydrolase